MMLARRRTTPRPEVARCRLATAQALALLALAQALGLLSSGGDLDLSASTDFEDLAVVLADLSEVAEQGSAASGARGLEAGSALSQAPLPGRAPEPS